MLLSPVYRPLIALTFTQAISAFNQNAIRAATVTWIAMKGLTLESWQPEELTGLSTILIVAPLCLLSLPAGRLADRCSRRDMILALKVIEIGICLFFLWGLLAAQPLALFMALALSGIEATAFGPAKLGIIPDLVPQDALQRANSLLGASLLAAILIGAIMGNLLVPSYSGQLALGTLIACLSLVGLAISFLIPQVPAAEPELGMKIKDFFADLALFSSVIRSQPKLLLAMLGTTWFWFQGAMNTTLFPLFVVRIGGPTDGVALLLLICTICSALGAYFSYRLLASRKLARHTPVIGLILALVPAYDLLLASNSVSEVSFARMAIDLASLAIANGLFWPPLNTTVLALSAAPQRARLLAANYTLHGLALIGAGLIISQLPELGLSIIQVFVINGCMTGLVAFWALRQSVLQRTSHN